MDPMVACWLTFVVASADTMAFDASLACPFLSTFVEHVS